MTVRAKIALTIFLTGLLTAIGVVATVLMAFQRFDHESTYYRADAFLKRVVMQHPDLMTMQQRFPEEFVNFLGGLVLYEPGTQLYLLDTEGKVLATTTAQALPANYRVALGPVREAASDQPMPYVMGDDPEQAGSRTVVAAKPLQRAVILPGQPVAGYLYLVCRPRTLDENRLAALRSSLDRPGMLLILGVVLLTTCFSVWMTATVTRPLARLTAAVSAVTRDGLEANSSGATAPSQAATALPDAHTRDEFGLLARGIGTMLTTLRTQWATLRRLDHFRREGVSNLSHDLRSPLTATTACLETLDMRWANQPERAPDRELLAVALRNTRNAARLVQSLGDLAQLDEPEFKLRSGVLDLTELMDDVAMRFAERAQRQGVSVVSANPDNCAVLAPVDIELLERAVANLVDNALKFCAPGGTITLSVACEGSMAALCVRDTGAGIAAADIPHLFDRFYQSRQSVAPATGEGGKGLGLAIVKRIVELHGGSIHVESVLGQGTDVTLMLPASG
jgi:signal transduction histidine kinase